MSDCVVTVVYSSRDNILTDLSFNRIIVDEDLLFKLQDLLVTLYLRALYV